MRSDNGPTMPGNYVQQRVEGVALLADDGTGHATVNGVTYPVVPINLFYSATRNDNIITTNSTAPEASYLPANGGTEFDNGYVFADGTCPGTLPL